MENQPKKEEKPQQPAIKIPALLQAVLERRRYGAVMSRSLKEIGERLEEAEINAESKELNESVFY